MPFDENSINSIINELRNNKTELPWVEFKVNNSFPQEIGEYISALSNTAALFNKNYAFLIWGIDDITHEIIGTDFDPQKAKQGNQNLDLWISTQLTPQVQFYFHKTIINGRTLILLEVMPAYSSPIKFKSIDYIRIDSNKKKLKDFPDTERELWANFSKKSFETMTALEDVNGEFVLRLIDYSSYFDMLSLDMPNDKLTILDRLQSEMIIIKNEKGNYNITNLGAILFARRLSDFPSLDRKGVRVIQYANDDRMSAIKEQVGNKGYANGFEGLIDFVNGLLPYNEVIGSALRKNVHMYPELTIRELVANAIIHQNLFVQGTSPMIEIFKSRLEITNPGEPLIAKDRFIDHPPISRNEKLASFMRRIGVCEERGSGYDKVIFETELYQLPAPEIEIYDNHTKIILFAHKKYTDMSKDDRIRACYLHACLKRVNRGFMTNSSLRERFGIDVKNTSMVSRLLNETCDVKLIKLAEEETSNKYRKYLPYWA